MNDSEFKSLLNNSVLDRDEAACLQEHGSLDHIDKSLSGISLGFSAIISERCALSTDSLFAGPTTSSERTSHINISNNSNNEIFGFGIPKISSFIGSTRGFSPIETNQILHTEFASSRLANDQICSGDLDTIQVECTHKVLSWPPVQIGEHSIKTCIIRLNAGINSEVINIKIANDGNNVFKIFKDNQFLSECNIQLKPLEAFEINIAFFSKKVSKFKAELIVTNAIKDVKLFQIYLNAYGGQGVMLINSQIDPITKTPCVFINARRLKSKITLNNIGTDWLYFIFDSSFRLNCDDKINIFPTYGHIKPNENVEINIVCSGVEHFFRNYLQNSNWLIKLAEIILYYGDESTRLRLLRLNNEYQSSHQTLFQNYNNTIKEISRIPFQKPSIDVDDMNDQLVDLQFFWQNGVKECKFDLFTQKTTFQSVEVTNPCYFPKYN